MDDEAQTKFHNFICDVFRLPTLPSSFGKDNDLYTMTMAVCATYLMHLSKANDVGGTDHLFVKTFLKCAIEDFKFTLPQLKFWSAAITEDFQRKNALRGW